MTGSSGDWLSDQRYGARPDRGLEDCLPEAALSRGGRDYRPDQRSMIRAASI